MKQSRVYGFEKLDVYKNSLQLSALVRTEVRNFPSSERYELISQLTRAMDSVAANLAEGSGRASNYDQAHFTNMAYSSALEVINHINLAFILKYIDADIKEQLRLKIDVILSQLNSLYKYQINNNNTLKKKVKNEQ